MIKHRNHKKNLIISYKNLPDTLRELFKETYPDGYKDYLQKTIKPNGEPIFVVPLETEDVSYMVKFDVKIDTTLVEEDIDKDDFSEGEEQEGPEMVPLQEAIDDEEGNRRVGTLRHGASEVDLDEEGPKKEFEIATRDMAEEFADLADDTDDDSYLDDEEDDDEEEDIEPNDEDLLDIETLLAEADNGEGLLREDNPPEEKRGRRKLREETPDIKAIKAVREAAKAAKVTEGESAKGKKAPKASATKTPKATKVKAEAPTSAKAAKTAPKMTTAVKTKAVKETAPAQVTKRVASKPKEVPTAKVSAGKSPAAKKVTKSAPAKKTTKKKED